MSEVVCVVCGHPPCPHCKDWCDTIVTDKDGEEALCCGGKCKYPEPDVKE